MPLFDGTGPQGFGPQTGRGTGPCGDGYGYGRRGFGFGRRGYGRGRGFRFWSAAPSKEDIKKDLDQYQKDLEEELEVIKTEKKKLEEEN
jgi:hypothetical protein